MTAWECAVYTCHNRLRRGQTFICAPCWKRVPAPLQDAYRDARNGARAHGHNSVELIQAEADCLTAVNGGAS
jgi:hypothetical protein